MSDSRSVDVMDEVYGVGSPDDVYAYANLRDYFGATLDKVSGRLTRQRALVMLLDGLDHVAGDDECLSWLPDAWPKHVHVVLTTDSAHLRSMRRLTNHVRRIIRSRRLNRYRLRAHIAEALILSERVIYHTYFISATQSTHIK